MKNREMHCHSTGSDGKNTQQEIVSEAQKKDLEFLTLTDHDVIASKDFQTQLRKIDIASCDSVEISARNYELEKSLHLVSYAKIFSDSLHQVLETARAGKERMKWGQFHRFTEQYGFSGSKEAFDIFMQQKLGRTPDTANKYDMARYFYSIPENKNIMASIISSLSQNCDIVVAFYEECMKRWGKLYDIYGYESEEYEPSVQQTTDEVVQKSRWIVSLAHPNVTFSESKWGIPAFQRTIGDYVEKWVNAIEINTKASAEWVETILETQKRFGLILTFGSDCHQIGYDGRDGKHASIGEQNPFIETSRRDKNFEAFREIIWL